MLFIPPNLRGAFDQRHQTLGGERWPGLSVGDATLVSSPAVQAALGPACRCTLEPPDGPVGRKHNCQLVRPSDRGSPVERRGVFN